MALDRQAISDFFRDSKSWIERQSQDLMAFMRRTFDAILNPDNADKNHGLFRLFIFAASMIAIALAIFIFIQLSALIFGADPFEKLGQTGDFFGGILNPLLTFLTFIGVLATIFLQREELKSTREEIGRQADALETQLYAIAKQNFEATLFQMLSLHNSNVNELRGIDGYLKPISGRAVFTQYVSNLNRTYGNGFARGLDPTDLSVWPEVYPEFWNEHRDALGHYFRLLYNMIRFVNTKMPGVEEDEDRAERMEYTRIIRAQLSDAELVQIFYNCFSGYGERLLVFALDYDLFNNLDERLLFCDSHREELRRLKGPRPT